MLINDKIDEGPLLAQATYDIEDDETTPSLTERLIDLSDQTLQHVLPAYLKDEIQPAPQQDASIAASKEPTYSRKLTKEDGAIDWQKPAETIEREIRAFIEWPKSHTQLGKQDIIITAAHVRKDVTGNLPGKVELLGKEILVHTADGCLVIDRLKPAGKQEMSAEAFLAGYRNTLD
jgi:methionyl-tRNA formyltransferase